MLTAELRKKEDILEVISLNLEEGRIDYGVSGSGRDIWSRCEKDGVDISGKQFSLEDCEENGITRRESPGSR